MDGSEVGALFPTHHLTLSRVANLVTNNPSVASHVWSVARRIRATAVSLPLHILRLQPIRGLPEAGIQADSSSPFLPNI